MFHSGFSLSHVFPIQVQGFCCLPVRVPGTGCESERLRGAAAGQGPGQRGAERDPQQLGRARTHPKQDARAPPARHRLQREEGHLPQIPKNLFKKAHWIVLLC